MKIRRKNTIIIMLAILFIIVIQLGRIIYVFSFEREGFHSDESYSYGFSNSFYDPYIYANQDGKIKNFNVWVSSQIFKDYLTVGEDERFSYGSIYFNQKKDMSPPLHSMILHTICSFFPEKFSWNFSLIINIAFFILTQIFLYFLGTSLTKSRWIGLLTCLFYGFTTGALNCYVYLRMYAMLTSVAVLFSYLHSRMYNQHFQKIYRDLLIIIGVTVIGVMTHYYFYVFAFFVAAFYCIYLACKKLWKAMFFYAGSMLLAVAISFIIYPYSIVNMINGASTYDYQMTYIWNLENCLSIFMSEITGFRIKLPDQSTVILVMAVLFAVSLLVASFGFLFRNEIWFSTIKQIIKKMPKRVWIFIDRTAKHLQWVIAFLYLAIIATLAVIAKVSFVYGMGIYTDRYLFFLMPLFCVAITSSCFYLLRNTSLKIVMQRMLLVLVAVAVLLMNNYWSGCNYLFQRNSSSPAIEDVTKDANCIIVTKADWRLTYYASKLKETHQFFAVLGSGCMLQGDELAKVDTSRPVYVIIEKSMFPNEDGKLPGFESAVITGGGHMGLDYTEQEYLDYLSDLDWVSQVTYISTEYGFTGNIDIYRLK